MEIIGVIRGVVNLVQIIVRLTERAFTGDRTRRVHQDKEPTPIGGGYAGAADLDPATVAEGVIHRNAGTRIGIRGDVGKATTTG